MKIFNGPDLSQARKRSRQETQVIKDSFDIPSSMQNIGEGQTYFIRTYGCQANEHMNPNLIVRPVVLWTDTKVVNVL